METLLNTSKLEITDNTIGYIKELRKWTMLLSIVGFIFLGIIILIIPILIYFQLNSYNIGLGLATTIPLILIVVLYFFPIYYLYMFSKHSKNAMDNLDANSLEIAFKYLKSHYKFMGILVIVILCLYLIAALFAGVTALMR